MPHRPAATLAAIVLGSSKVAAGDRAHIRSELDEITNIRRLHPNERRRLLQLIHAMRAFDTSLAAVARHHGCVPVRPSMGAYLVEFARLSALPFTGTDRQYFQARLVRRRNSLMHEAGNYPAGDQEVISLIGLMYACVSKLL